MNEQPQMNEEQQTQQELQEEFIEIFNVDDFGELLNIYTRVQELLTRGLDINKIMIGYNGYTPFMYAINNGDTSNEDIMFEINNVINLLLREGANPNIPNNFGDTALHDAINRGFNTELIVGCA
jgi:ankyrin repeat protein